MQIVYTLLTYRTFFGKCAVGNYQYTHVIFKGHHLTMKAIKQKIRGTPRSCMIKALNEQSMK